MANDQSSTQINDSTGSGWLINGNVSYGFGDYGDVSMTVDKSGKQKGMRAKLFFKLAKKKFGVLEKMRLDNRVKKLEKAFNKAIDDGQNALAEKFMDKLIQESRECILAAKGIKFFIESDDLNKYKHKVRGGHISDTPFEKFTRIIPKKAIEMKKKFEGVFDGFVIYHYWNESQPDVKKMTSEEKQDMKDPILFGTFKDSSRFYHLFSWNDDKCDLNFDEIVDVISDEADKEDKDFMISKKSDLKV